MPSWLRSTPVTMVSTHPSWFVSTPTVAIGASSRPEVSCSISSSRGTIARGGVPRTARELPATEEPDFLRSSCLPLMKASKA